MRSIVIGLGSMGRRRMRLIRQAYPEYALAGVDISPERRAQCTEQFGVPVFSELEPAIGQFCPDTAFVCTSPLSHGTIIGSCLDHGLHIFTEINLVSDGYEENMQLAAKKGVVLFLSSTFLYREEVRFIRNEVRQSGSSTLYSLHVGQYLPDWHPWESYQDYFIGSVRTNGCREILAINLPWIVNAFGPIRSVSAVSSRQTQLKIAYPDTCMALITHQNGSVGTLSAELVARDPIYEARVNGEQLQLRWNGKPDGLERFDIANKRWEHIFLYDTVERVQQYNPNTIENAYRAEITAFFDQITQLARSADYSFADDLVTLEWIDRIEQA